MQKVIVTSQNPAKINAVKSAFREVFPDTLFDFCGVNVASEVPDQPISDTQTRQGALNRIKNAKAYYPGGDYYVGIEAGNEGEFTFAWMIIESEEKRGESRSASLMLPPVVLDKLVQGMELGDVMDAVYATENIKQKGGAIGLLTNHLLTRSSVYHQALILALIPFINAGQYPTTL